MSPADIRAEMLRYRDRAEAQRDALAGVIHAIDAALPLFGDVVASAPPVAATPPPRPQSPAPPVTNGAGHDDKVLAALKFGPRTPMAIREMTELSEYQVNARLKALVASKKIRRTGTGPRNTQYQLA